MPRTGRRSQRHGSAARSAPRAGPEEAAISSPTALVTGANRGFGLALCAELARRDYRVIAICRRAGGDLPRLPVDVVPGVDLSTDEGISLLAERMPSRLQLLIANAGVYEASHLADLDPEPIRRSFETNALGALRTVHAALPALKSGSKVVLVSSLAGSIGDNGAGGEYAYRMSKAALNMAGVSLARDLASRGVAVGIYHPGRLARPTAPSETIRMPLSPDVAEPAVAAAELLDEVERLDLETSGRFLTRRGDTIPW